ncbi:MAG: carbamate kinase [Mycoplasmoidaceae bacterium]|nr:MAG: carbamate kinase [Mycoplasmoidaceae bacterium]
MKKQKIVISVGGNALSNNPETDAKLLQPVADLIYKLYKQGNKILLTTGNGPQSGELYDCFNDANKYNSKHTALTLDEANAISQGYIGYHVMKSIKNKFSGLDAPIACLQTLTIVDEKDPGFQNPTKPIGSFFKTLEEAKKTYPNDIIVEDAGRGFRKVVASPKPKSFVGFQAISKLLDANIITIAGIGGGVPCIIKNNKIIGKEGVIDKDFSTSKLAQLIKADMLILLTGVKNVMLDFNTSNAKPINKTKISEIEKYLTKYDFGKGSMEPKLKAAIEFTKASKHIAVITDLKNASNAIQLKAGTIIEK